MATVTPCATPVRRRSYEPGYSQTQRAFGRHFGDDYIAPTLLRIGGEWRSVTTPSQDLVDSADLVLQGGHVYTISQAIVDDITAAGLCVATVTVGIVVPDEGLYPSSLTYPGGTTYVGIDDGVTPPAAASFLPGDTYLPSDTTYPGE